MHRAAMVLATLGLAGTARAQAPGETAPSSPALRRWAVELSVGGASWKPKGGDRDTGFALLGLAGRYRISRPLEVALGLQLGGGKQDGVELSAGSLFAELRYRFRPQHAWDVFGLAGLGVASVAPKTASDDDKRGRGSLRLGAGVERNFGAFALDATLRLVGIAENRDATPDASPFARFGVGGLAFAVAGSYSF